MASVLAVPTVVPLDQLRSASGTALFEGGDEVPLSVFVVAHERGQGPEPHFHPYPELFVVEAGTGTFTVDGEETTVTAGHIVVVPGGAVHQFKGAGDDTLRLVAIHPSPSVVQTNV